jgi:acid stress-induced BolA-like protein IbaG/YrbA
MTAEALRMALETLPLPYPPEVSVINGRRLIAVVTSAAFENMDESERQRLVYNHLLATFDTEDLGKVEMVLTDAPSERARVAAS